MASEKKRCACGDDGDIAPKTTWIQCETCHVWQHNICMGLMSDERLAPNHYFCETCKPHMHRGFKLGAADDNRAQVTAERRRMQGFRPTNDAQEATKKDWLAQEIMAHVARVHREMGLKWCGYATSLERPLDMDAARELADEISAAIGTVLKHVTLKALESIRLSLVMEFCEEDETVVCFLWGLRSWLRNNMMAKIAEDSEEDARHLQKYFEV